MSADRDLDTNYDISAFANELRRLADALEAGEDYTIDIEGEEVLVPEDVSLSISYGCDDDGGELEFQLSWSVAEDNEDEEEMDAETSASHGDAERAKEAEDIRS